MKENGPLRPLFRLPVYLVEFGSSVNCPACVGADVQDSALTLKADARRLYVLPYLEQRLYAGHRGGIVEPAEAAQIGSAIFDRRTGVPDYRLSLDDRAECIASNDQGPTSPAFGREEQYECDKRGYSVSAHLIFSPPAHE